MSNQENSGKTQIILAIISGIVAVVVAVVSTMATIYTKDSSLKENISEIEELENRVDAMQVRVIQAVPVGTVIPYAGELTQQALESLEQSGWLPCTGKIITKVRYPELFEAIGTTYGSSDGLGSFRLPDLSGRVVMGSRKSSDTISERKVGSALGKDSHRLSVSELPDHSHPYTDSHYHDQLNADKNYATKTGDDTGALKSVTRQTQKSSAMKGDSFSIVQPSIVMNYIIKYR